MLVNDILCKLYSRYNNKIKYHRCCFIFSSCSFLLFLVKIVLYGRYMKFTVSITFRQFISISSFQSTLKLSLLPLQNYLSLVVNMVEFRTSILPGNPSRTSYIPFILDIRLIRTNERRQRYTSRHCKFDQHRFVRLMVGVYVQNMAQRSLNSEIVHRRTEPVSFSVSEKYQMIR